MPARNPKDVRTRVKTDLSAGGKDIHSDDWITPERMPMYIICDQRAEEHDDCPNYMYTQDVGPLPDGYRGHRGDKHWRE